MCKIFLQISQIQKHDEDKLDIVMSKLDIPIFSKSQKTFLNEYTEIMAIVADALDNLQANKYPYAVVLPTLYETKDKLADVKSKAFVHCKPLATAVYNGFCKRFDEIMDLKSTISLPALIATVTHPYFKLRWLKPEMCTSERIDKLKQILSYAADEISAEKSASDERKAMNEEKNQQTDEKSGMFCMLINYNSL